MPKTEKKVTRKRSTPTAKAAKTDKPVSNRHAGKTCQMKDCKREYRAKGYCRFHYRQWRQGKFGRARYKTCSDRGCRAPMVINRHGLCEEHHQNYYVKGMEQAKAPEKPAAKPAAPAAAAS